MNHLQELRRGLSLCIIKKEGDKRASSLAISKSGKQYLSGFLESDTHLLFISSEQGALCLSMQNSDFGVEKIITLKENIDKKELMSPIVVKTMIDYRRRTGNTLAYEIIDIEGNSFFETDDITKLVEFYQPEIKPLKKTKNKVLSDNSIEVDKKDIEKTLKKYALLGIQRNFPKSDSAAGYGTAIITKSGKLYFSGQYSSFEKRTNIHSEMAAPLSAFMNGEYDIEYLGLVSSKFKDTPTQMCGCCRQFLSEMMARFNFNPKIYCFASETDAKTEQTMNNYLPGVWTSKKW